MIKTLIFALALFICPNAVEDEYDVFVPIAKYLEQGDAEKLSAWFADNVDIAVLTDSGECSRNQARQILKAFFTAHNPSSFTIAHAASKSNIKYAIGTLQAGSASYEVTIFVSMKNEKFQIQQLKIEVRR